MFVQCIIYTQCTHTHTHTHTLQAIALDPENASYRANLQTVEDQLRGDTGTASGVGGGATGGGGGGADQQGGGANPLGGEQVKL